MIDDLIEFPEGENWGVLYYSYIAICDHNYRAAMVLREIKHHIASMKYPDRFFMMTQSFINDRCLETLCNHTYRVCMDLLISKGFITVIVRQGKFQRVRFNFTVVQDAINKLPPRKKKKPIHYDSEGSDENFTLFGDVLDFTGNSELLPVNFTGNREVTSPETVNNFTGNGDNHYTSNETSKRQANKANPTTPVVNQDSVDTPSSSQNSLHAYALTGSGSTIDNRLRDSCHIANSDISPSSESNSALECNETVRLRSGNNIEHPISIPGSSEINNLPMTPHEVVQSIFSTYAKLPNSSKDHRQKGSAVQLFRKFGDLLIKTVGDDGEVAIAAFTSFLDNEYWKSQGWPFYAFASQYNEFLIRGDGEGPEKANDSLTPQKNAKFATSNKRPAPGFPSKFPAKSFDEPAQRFIPVYKPDSTAKARHKRDEALTLLQSANSALFNDCMDELYGPITDKILEKIDSWHGCAVAEFRVKLKREPVVKCKYLVSGE